MNAGIFFKFSHTQLVLQALSSPVLPPWTSKAVHDMPGTGGPSPLVVAQSFQRTRCISVQVRTRSICCWDTDRNGGTCSGQPVASALGSPNRSTQLSGLLHRDICLFQFSISRFLMASVFFRIIVLFKEILCTDLLSKNFCFNLYPFKLSYFQTLLLLWRYNCRKRLTGAYSLCSDYPPVFLN